jgi:hypothetical protein
MLDPQNDQKSTTPTSLKSLQTVLAELEGLSRKWLGEGKPATAIMPKTGARRSAARV